MSTALDTDVRIALLYIGVRMTTIQMRGTRMANPTQDDGADEDIPLYRLAEQLPITLLDSVVLATRRDNGQIYLSIRDISAALALSRPSQQRRLRTHAVFSQALGRFQIQTPGGLQTQTFVELEKVSAWLLGVNISKVNEEMRPRLLHFQFYLVREVHAAFSRLTGLPEKSDTIEDLDDLGRIDTAMIVLSDRQSEIEHSQDRARQAWRDMHDEMVALRARIEALEMQQRSTVTTAIPQSGGVISREQRGSIYQLVQSWADAATTHDPRLSVGAARAACWVAVKKRYKLAKYEHLPAERYKDCVRFIKAQYRTLTGEELDAPEQQSLDLGGL